ncbi:aminotransferase class I/II-fold pyridoxal phosphate-dependent enzyme [Roseisalinus antarcticus]|uniref:Aminotransferase n=1 Tax=Roseisalinus antarcticus TaxID=254357 RepID=A0A1Y5ST08_9RHOB|nr:aminotransferase class I/II-fold pyridoxal phosphate-dependent enzyme [Roseisalinus antarcticus]SLN44560.1 Histidinol-phosphate aminotransferase [Roseisalinus antarcticus]
MTSGRDHGGGLDAAIASYGGRRPDWLDLSTGINPLPYELPDLDPAAWTALPDAAATARLIEAARAAWNVPDAADIVAAPGASALIVRLPEIAPPGPIHIPGPTYNEHAAAARLHGRTVTEAAPAPTTIRVHPNNPDGRLWDLPGTSRLTIVDESFCDIWPDKSHIAATARPGTLILKSFGKFWGLAGLRLGFAIAHPDTMSDLAERLGPWPVSGPALRIGACALRDREWAAATRGRLAADAAHLDKLMTAQGARPIGGTPLFRLYETADAAAWQARLAASRVWSRIFPYSDRWLRLGLPHPDHWQQLETAIAGAAARGTAGGAMPQASVVRRP